MRRTFLLGVVLPFAIILSANNVHAIIGGTNAAPGAFPAQVLISLPNNAICGGTILNQNHVLTAARCVFDLQTHLIPANTTTVRVGILNTQDQTAPINVLGIFPHPLYNAFSNENNLAVLRTAANIPLRPGTPQQPAIATANLAEQITPDNAQCTISGWNPTVAQPNVPLTFLTVPVMNRDACNAVAVHMGRVHESMMCAGTLANNVGVCANTQGGGLICNQNNQQQLVAVLTGGFGCGAGNSPGIYTQVRVHRQWILQQLTRNDIPAAGPTPTPPVQGANVTQPAQPGSGAEKEMASVIVLLVSVFCAIFKF